MTYAMTSKFTEPVEDYKPNWLLGGILWIGLPLALIISVIVAEFVSGFAAGLIPDGYFWAQIGAMTLSWIAGCIWAGISAEKYGRSKGYSPNWALGGILWIGIPLALVTAMFLSGVVVGLGSLALGYGFFLGNPSMFFAIWAIPASWIAGLVWAVNAIGNHGQSKGYSKAGFVVFAVFFPLIALIVVLVISPSGMMQHQQLMKMMATCPSCAELVQPQANVCRHCGRDIKPVREPAMAA